MPRPPSPYPERGWYGSRPFGRYLKLCPVADGLTEARRQLRLALGEMETERGGWAGGCPPS